MLSGLFFPKDVCVGLSRGRGGRDFKGKGGGLYMFGGDTGLQCGQVAGKSEGGASSEAALFTMTAIGLRAGIPAPVSMNFQIKYITFCFPPNLAAGFLCQNISLCQRCRGICLACQKKLNMAQNVLDSNNSKSLSAHWHSVDLRTKVHMA